MHGFTNKFLIGIINKVKKGKYNMEAWPQPKADPPRAKKLNKWKRVRVGLMRASEH